MKEKIIDTPPKPKMLFVHHGGELYGSDRVFAQTVRDASALVNPVVVLSVGGPLEGLLREFSSEIHIKDLGVLRRRHLSLPGMVTTFWLMLRAILFLCLLIKKNHVRSVYTSTVSILSSPFAAKVVRVPHVWHVHEIILTPRFLCRLFSWLVPRFSCMVVCNSQATKQNLLGDQIADESKIRVVHNGIDYEQFLPSGSRERTRSAMGIEENIVFVGVVGRVHRWKGQYYFLEAAGYLKDIDPQLVFGIIGGAYDSKGDDQVWRMKQLAINKGIDDRVIFKEFEPRISEIYQALDIVVVPSTLPEPFGLVSIEAMAASRPVIATAHGGSLEIVEDGVTGFLVPLHRPEVLAEKIEILACDTALRRKMGEAGRRRVIQLFSKDLYRVKIQNVIDDCISFRNSHAGENH